MHEVFHSTLSSPQVAPDGLCSYCKPCNAAAAAERRAKRPAHGSPTIAAKVCSHCQQVRRDAHCRPLHAAWDGSRGS
jgi:hypothetical protein